MIETKRIKLALSLSLLYVLAGVIIFPSWYFDILEYGGFSELFYYAQTRFALWNLLALAVICCAVFIIALIEKHKNEFYLSMTNSLKGKIEITFVFIFLVAIFRLSNAAYSYNSVDISTLAEKIQTLENGLKSKLAISLPIEFLYINTTQAEDLYSQISPKLQLSERNVGKKKEASIEGEVGVEGVASAGAKSDYSQESKDKYTSRNLSASEKLITIANYLKKENKLFEVLPITLESKELAEIDEAVRTLKSYNLNIDPEKLKNTKDRITAKAFQSRVSETYKVNSWVLISGPISIASNENNKSLSITFDYVSGKTANVSFNCKVPKSGLDKAEVDQLLEKPMWELSVFGKIIHIKNGNDMSYSLNCLAIFR